MYIEFKNGKKFAGKEADIADSHEGFKDAGYLLTDDDLVVDVDVLDKTVLKILIKTFDIKTQTVWTERGAHFYFKKPQGFRGSKKVCPLGFEIEFKHLKNTQAVTIKQNGVLRLIDNENVRQELPDIFSNKKKLESLLGFQEHEGRNNALFAHRMKIHNLDRWQSMLRFINNHVFAAALSEEEFQQIAREGVKVDASTSTEPEMADYLINKYRIVFYNKGLYWFDFNKYIQDNDKLKRMIIHEIGDVKTRIIDEIIKQMEYRSPMISTEKVFPIRVKNGTLKNGYFEENESTEFTPYTIDIPYIEDAEPVEIVDEYINQLTSHDAAYRDRLLEIMAHTLIVDKEFKRMLAKFFIFVGDGANGKGTLLAVIRKILGYENCSGLSIKNMTDERYFTALQGRLVNLGDDVEDQPIDHEQMKMLKNISSCDFISTRKLFEQSTHVELTISLIFTSNHILSSFEKGFAYQRRVEWCPMFCKVTKRDPYFISKLTTKKALIYWLKLMIDAYKRLYENIAFTKSDLIEKYNADYHAENNTVLLFLGDCTKESLVGLKSPEAYLNYTEWAEENGLKIQSKKLFVKSIYDVFGLELYPIKINGKTARVFKGKNK